MLKRLTISFGTGTGAKLSVSLVAPILEKVFWECSCDTKTVVLAPWGLSKVHLYAAESLGKRVVTGAAGEDACLQLPNDYVLSLQITCCVWLMSCSIVFNLTTKLNSCMICHHFFWQDWLQHEHHNLVQQIEKHMVTHFSVLDLTMVYDDGYERSMRHVFGPSVLHLLDASDSYCYTTASDQL
jgi:hypothetical protein